MEETSQYKLMEGKKGVIFGVANEQSLAWGIAKEVVKHGAEVVLTYPEDSIKKRVIPLAENLGTDTVCYCNVKKGDTIDATFKVLKEKWGTIDFLVHAVAFSDKGELRGRYIDTSLDNFLNSMHISCYSFTELVKKAESIMSESCSLLTMTYCGAERVIPHYNVMGVCKAALEASVRYLAYELGPRGVRVNAISAGPMRTLASSAIGGFHYILEWNRHNSPLRRNTTLDDVGRAGLYLLSDLSGGTTGHVLYSDCGYNIIGMKGIDAPDIIEKKREDGV